MAWELSNNKYMSDNEVRRLRTTVEDKALADSVKGRSTWLRIWLMIDIATKTGFRVAEMANIRTPDIDLSKEPSITVNGKGNKVRTVYIDSGLKKHIKDHIRMFGLNDSDYLLKSSHGKKYTTRALQKHFKLACRLSGLPQHYSIHCCRHTVATMLMEKTNGNLRLIQKVLGHSSVTTTTVYADIKKQALVNAMSSLF